MLKFKIQEGIDGYYNQLIQTELVAIIGKDKPARANWYEPRRKKNTKGMLYSTGFRRK